MSFLPRLSVVPALVLASLLLATACEAVARIQPEAGPSGDVVAPMLLRPLAQERVPESTARLEIAPGRGVRDVRVVAARFAFDLTGWSALPTGPAWTVRPCESGSLPLASLGLADRTDTPLWWAVTWTDERTGAFRASAAREFTLVPRFSNRTGVDGAVHPSAMGRLAGRVAAGGALAGARRPIELASGYTIEPGETVVTLPEPTLPGSAAAGGRGAYLVQFADGSPDSAKARIARAGGTLVSPISGAGFLVRMPADAVAGLAAMGGDPWIAPYEPAHKVSRTFADTAAVVEVTALMFPESDGAAAAAALRALGAAKVEEHRGELNHLMSFELDRSKLAEAATIADVAWLEPTPRYTFDNDRAQWVLQSNIENSRPVFDHGLRGQGQVVMTSDSGIRANHEMFADTLVTISDFGDFPTHRKIIAYKRGADSPGILFGDDVGYDYHGTHTAGTVAGNPEATSAAPWSGLAKDAKLYFMDLAGAGGGGLKIPADLNDLFAPSYEGNAGGKARISSNSWGAYSQAAYTIQSMQLDQFVWSHPDYLIAFASGNIGAFATVNSPGTAKNVLTVGATGNGDLADDLANFSSRGPAKDGRRKPTLVAPGVDVVSSIGSTRYTYAGYNGTSMATPAVAGTMALVRQYLTEGWYPTGAPVAANAFEPSAALLRAMAVSASRNDVVSYRAPDNSIGYGRLTIDDVLHFPGDALRTMLIDPADGLADDHYVEYQVQVTDPSQPLKIALCWSDAPANPASQVQLVNDLDLVVTNGTSTYRGNYVLNNVSIAGGYRDSLNVEEFVRLATPQAGLWTVRVEGRSVVSGPQPFALCITGGVGASTGAVAFDRFQYGLTDTLGIEVIDTNASGTVRVVVSSTSEPWTERVTLTGANGVYRGAIPVAPVTPSPGDGRLAVSTGDLLSVSYADASPAVQVVATARVDAHMPMITGVEATVLGGTQALVTWTTDVAGTSRVRFGKTGALASVVDSGGVKNAHAVLLTGLDPSSAYVYDVETTTTAGETTRDSVGGAHRSFTTRRPGSIALLMDDPDPAVLATWINALAALGVDTDVLPAAANDPPLVGNSQVGLRRYDAVLWQVGQDNYPPFSDAQRAAIDSLLEGGGRLLVTGHDIGFGLSDAGAPSYSLEREEWLEQGLKTRYFVDNFYADTLTGVIGNPVSGAFTGTVPLVFWLYPDSGDNMGAAPGVSGTWAGDWTDNFIGAQFMGMHWESSGPKGTPGVGRWGGQTSRLVGMFYEWRALEGASTAHLPARTAVLQKAVGWLAGHESPEVHLVLPTPGTVVTSDLFAIKYSMRPDAGRTITSRALEYSLDGGATWSPLTSATFADSGAVWDLAGVFGGAATPNSTRAMLRVRVTDDGTPALSSTAVMTGTFTLARPGGDGRGPVLVAGSAAVSPAPLRNSLPATLSAAFTDAETGGGGVAAAEYSTGPSPAAAGSGTPMSGAFGGATVPTAAVLATGNVVTGSVTLWVRARDTAGNWGAATALTVPSSGPIAVAVDEIPAVDFLASPSPNPFRTASAIRFGLAHAGDANLELFDVTGRRVRTLVDGPLAAGNHVATWDGRDDRGRSVGVGVYFVRLKTPTTSFHKRVIALE